MRRAIIGFSDRLNRLCLIGAGICFSAMLVFVAIQVIARYIFQAPPTWTEELARYSMVWGGLLGATVAYKTRFDPVLIRLADRGSALARWTMISVRSLATIMFMGPVLYYAIFGPGMNAARGFLGRSIMRTADTLGFPMIYVAMAVPVAAGVILIHLLAQWAGDRPPAEQEQS